MLVRLATNAMGTRFEAVLVGRDRMHLEAAGEAALEAIREHDRRLSRFRPDSLLSRVNREAETRPVRVDAELLELLACCDAVHRASRGAFDVSVGPLMRAWGFHGAPGDLDDAHAATGLDGMVLDPEQSTVRFTRLGMALDLGGVAKGHALDAAGDILRELSVPCALVHGGTSTTIAIGAPPGTKGWRVALGGEGLGPVAVLRDTALAVSAPHGRVVEHEGTAATHVLDPATGMPATGPRLAAVACDRAVMADAWATALLVRAPDAMSLPDHLAVLIDTGADDGSRWSGHGPWHRRFVTDHRGRMIA